MKQLTETVACKTKELKQSKIAWGGFAVAFLGAIQLSIAGLDITKLQSLETAVPELITIATGVAIIVWRNRSQYIIG